VIVGVFVGVFVGVMVGTFVGVFVGVLVGTKQAGLFSTCAPDWTVGGPLPANAETTVAAATTDARANATITSRTPDFTMPSSPFPLQSHK
jgi:hypothetical protein